MIKEQIEGEIPRNKSLYLVSVFGVLMFLNITLFCSASLGQTVAASDLIGRWKSLKPIAKSDLVFVNEHHMHSSSSEGLILAQMEYSLLSKKGRSSLRFTSDNSEKKRYVKAGIRLLNDSTLLFKRDSYLPRNSDTTKKTILVLRKTSYQASAFYKPSHYELIGNWRNYFKGRIGSGGIVFKDSVNAVLTNQNKVETFNYHVDFSRQPITIDFYNATTKLPALIRFYDESNMRIELFPNQDKADRFRAFGHNYWMKKVSQ